MRTEVSVRSRQVPERGGSAEIGNGELDPGTRVHVPHASGDRTFGTGILSDLRDGARAANGCRGREQSGIRGYATPFLGQRRSRCSDFGADDLRTGAEPTLTPLPRE